MVKWGEPLTSRNPIGRPRRPKGDGIYERYAPSTYTVDQDPDDETLQGARKVVGAVTGIGRALVGDDPPNSQNSLEQLSARVDRIEQAVWQLAQQAMGGGEQQADDNGAGSKPDEASPGFAPPAKGRPGITSDVRRRIIQDSDAMTSRRTGSRITLEAMNKANQTLRR